MIFYHLLFLLQLLKEQEWLFRNIILLGGTALGLIIVAIITNKLFAVQQFAGVYTGFKKILADKWYIDELYNSIIVKPLNSIAGFLKIYR